MSGSWSVLANPPPFGASTMLLLTDGRVICQDGGGTAWWALTPDDHGSYELGTWSPIASTAFPRLYYASAVLADGRVLVAGGEYSDTSDGNRCEIYDPVADTWTTIAPPPGWDHIGDAPCCVLADGRVLLGDINNPRTVIYDPVANAWSATGAKHEPSSEETWTLLRDGSVMTVECQPVYPKASERYVPSSGTWVDAGSTQVDLVDHSFSIEMGPHLLLLDGRLVAFGGPGTTAIYSPGSGTWAQGPDMPIGSDGVRMTVRDAPGALLPNGRVLCCAGLGTKGWGATTSFFEFNLATDALSPVPAPVNYDHDPYDGRMTLLPTGQVLYGAGTNVASLYTPTEHLPHRREERIEPEITSDVDELIPGGHHKVSGRRFNGMSQSVSYGDDCSCATNYPIARLRYHDGRVVYCRTHGHSTMGIATGAHIVHTTLEVPAAAPSGEAKLEIVANGIPSDPVEVKVK